VLDKKAAEALKFYFAEPGPAAANAALRTELYELTNLEQKLNDEVAAKAGRTYAAARVMLLGLGAAAVLLAVIAALLVIRSIARQLGSEPAHAASILSRVADGDLTVEIAVKPGDRSSLLHSVRNLVERLQLVLAELKRMSAAHDAGDIDVQIDAAKFPGEFRTVTQSINGMVSGHIAVKKKAMACIAEFGRGNFDAPLDKFPGKKAFINDTIEQVRTNLKALIDDSDRLIEAASAGKLDVRADLTRHQGDFAKIVEGLNGTLDVVAGPLNDVKRVLAALAEGDLTSTIDKPYEGAFGEMKDYANNTVLKLSMIIGEVNTAAQALSSAAEQVSATSHSLSQAATEQAASVEETSASMEEITASISHNTDNAKVTDGIATKASGDAAEGGNAVKATVAAMKQIADKSGRKVHIHSIAMSAAAPDYAVVAGQHELNEWLSGAIKAADDNPKFNLEGLDEFIAKNKLKIILNTTYEKLKDVQEYIKNISGKFPFEMAFILQNNFKESKFIKVAKNYIEKQYKGNL